MSISHAIVLAAGLGKRMRPITDSMPKPMIEVAGRSLINRALDQLETYGLNEVVVNTSYKAEMLEEHISHRPSPTIHISREETPLETGGGIYQAMHLLGGNEPFISMNSDTICVDTSEHTALTRMAESWNPDAMDILMLLFPTDRAIGYPGAGDMVIEDNKLRRRGEDASAPYIFTGVQIIHPRIFKDVPSEPFSMNVLYDRLLDAQGYFSRIGYVVHEGDWLHVGDPDGLKQAEEYYAKRAA
ncbi:MAG: nucleotidyltransferase family protein [Rickettsiales bacterium]|nr:nucleotidyltransferase family protein [Rickettsiales bacterium]